MRVLTLALVVACSKPSSAPNAAVTANASPAAERSANAAGLGLPYEGHPAEGLVTAGQPAPAQWSEVAASGVTTVINLRTEGEPGTEGEADSVEAAGLEYVHLPVGSDDLTEAKARALADAMSDADGPVLVHCGTSNRVGALLALKAFYVDGRSMRDALQIGLAGGMTRAEPMVRQQLAASCADSPHDERC